MALPKEERTAIPTIPELRFNLLGRATAVKIYQERPSGSEPVILVQPRPDQFVIITQLIATLVSGSSADWSAFVNYDGVETSEDTAIVWNKNISSANSPHAFELNIVLEGGMGSLSVRSSVAGAVNFTAIGWITYRE